MKCAEEYMRLYAVTDRAWVGGQTLYQQVESALKGGVTCVQLREKELDEEAFLKEAFALHDLCKKYNVPFFINDNVDIAIRCHAEGIHVGQEDMAAAQVRQRVGDKMMIGVSVHSVEEALEAVRHGADCLGVGAAFSTHTKADVDQLNAEHRYPQHGGIVEVPQHPIHPRGSVQLEPQGAHKDPEQHQQIHVQQQPPHLRMHRAVVQGDPPPCEQAQIQQAPEDAAGFLQAGGHPLQREHPAQPCQQHHGAHRTASLNLFSLPLPHHASLLLLCRSPVFFLHYITSVL